MKKSGSILLALVVLLGNTGFSVSTHYCGGVAVASSLVSPYAEPLSCEAADIEQKCDRAATLGHCVKQKSCCKDHYWSLDVVNDFSIDAAKSSFEARYIISRLVSFFQSPFATKNEDIEHENYVPPLLEHDVLALHQVFLL